MATILAPKAQTTHRLRDSYAAGARVLAGVLAGRSLDSALEAGLKNDSRAALRAGAQDLAYKALRAYGVVDAILASLRSKALPDPVLHALFYVCLPDLREHPDRAYMFVDEAVEAAVLLGRGAARGLVNAILRNYLRSQVAIEASISTNEVVRYQHSRWWIDAIRTAFPDTWETILAAGNGHPPMTLRVNRKRTSVEAYGKLLEAAGIASTVIGDSALRLSHPVTLTRLPGFEDGFVSVQDAGAQRAAALLDLRDGMRTLDACAAPGGKTGHMLELAKLAMTAVDNDPIRLARIDANLHRLGMRAKLVRGDCTQPQAWWDGRLFERILADVPCSASGVVRRHPDIKWLRQAGDIGRFARLQATMLNALWPLLAPGGRMLYVTCSLFPQENEARITAFLAGHADATRVSLPLDQLAHPGSLLPDENNDGFYFALLEKR